MVLDCIVTISVGVILYCVCFNWFCNVCVCMGFVMCGCVGFVICGCFGIMCTCIYCVFSIVSFMYIYSYLFCLYWCKDYCQRVTTQL